MDGGAKDSSVEDKAGVGRKMRQVIKGENFRLWNGNPRERENYCSGQRVNIRKAKIERSNEAVNQP